MIFFYIPNRFKHSGKSLRCLYLLFRIETIVAIPTIIFMITFSEIMKKYLASAYRRFRIICGLLKQLASDFLLCGCFALHQFVKFLKENHKQEYIVNILIGRKTDEIKSNHHSEVESFGFLESEGEKFVATLIRQGVIGDYLSRDLENYGNLKLTDKGRDFIENPTSFKIVEDIDYSDADVELSLKEGASCAADPELYAILKDLRKKIARKQNLPPYVIFQEPSLEAMATTYPITEEELANIPGVGLGKAKRYGKEFIEVIKRHVAENEIIRPEDIRVRSVPKENNLKVSVIQAIDRKIDLDELAESKGLEFEEMLDVLESIVEAGTKIDINYFIYEILDDEQVEDIMDYFRESEEDDLENAIQELGDEYEENNIRLVRVKFISEMGN